ncbi:MAG: bifunctional 23S rRNA (guanine(2069)-N(7))-methyltransferase RlmK/23S rRNA (guanine(2445)-N(2))-methyltransferase RlmL [Pseudomonadota bacterium]
MTDHTLFVTAARSLEPQLADELAALGATAVKPGRGGVYCTATLAVLYRVCLRSRLASRVLLPLAAFDAADDTALYTGCRSVDWAALLAPGATLAVDFSSSRSTLTHTRFGAQRVKDAVVDVLRDARGERPDVDRDQPDCRINAYLLDNRAQLALDLGGGALHRRPWLAEGGRPAVPANLAAALLQKSGWPDTAQHELVCLWSCDGTVAIEAAEMAAGLAPNRSRAHWGFLGWQDHDPSVWDDALAAGDTPTPEALPRVVAVEPDRRLHAVARAAIRAAGVTVELDNTDPVTRLRTRPLTHSTLVVATPVNAQCSDSTWPALGDGLKHAAAIGPDATADAEERAHRAGVLVPNLDCGKQLGLRARKRNQFRVDQDDWTLLQLPLDPDHVVDRVAAAARRQAAAREAALARGADALVNRIRKNQRTVGKWAAREQIACYRLYDADLPEYALAIDLFGEHAHIQEYAAPSSVDAARAAQRLEDAVAVLPEALGIPAERCVVKRRQRQRGDAQYQKHDDTEAFIRVTEGGARFAVNLHDYLDTGLFLDHRTTRRIVADLARGKRLLNLFGYTGSVTVQAALAGAAASLTVDMSQTYLDWAGRNFSLNQLDGRAHRLERADVLSWLATHTEHYDVVFLDPPTFSNSKRMSQSFDVQRDHVPLMRNALARLAPGGTLVFSTNHRRFKLDEAAFDDCDIDNISARTLPRDFARNPRIHTVWTLSRAA